MARKKKLYTERRVGNRGNLYNQLHVCCTVSSMRTSVSQPAKDNTHDTVYRCQFFVFFFTSKRCFIFRLLFKMLEFFPGQFESYLFGDDRKKWGEKKKRKKS